MVGFDVESIRQDFPCLTQEVYGKPLVYLDNAATAQKPKAVTASIMDYYESCSGNVHRGAHSLSERATKKYNDARQSIAKFINASAKEIVFTRSTTEAINLVAQCLAKSTLKPNDEIILTEMEHHANIVPWYILSKELGVKIKVARVLDDGSLDISKFIELFNKNTKLVCFAHASNALGTINPVKKMIEIAKSYGAITLIDGAQAIHHMPVDVSDLDVDFYCFSGHKAYGPTGIGVLYGKNEWLDRFPPYQVGGDMVETVSFDQVTFAKAPTKFEAGTPNIAGAIGLGSALDYIAGIGFANISNYEQSLYNYAKERLLTLKQVKIIGDSADKVSLISFVIDRVHPHDISTIFDRQGVAIRAGHLCAQPIINRYGLSAICRASFAFYNTHDEVDIFIDSFNEVNRVFKL